MKKVWKMLKSVFSRDPNRDPVPPAPMVGLTVAKARNADAAENLRATLTELLHESDRLNFRSVTLIGPREGQN